MQYFQHLLYEVVPKDTRWIFVDPDVCSYIDGIVLHHWSGSVFPLCSKQFPQLSKSCKSPVTLVRIESVIRRCRSSQSAVKGNLASVSYYA